MGIQLLVCAYVLERWEAVVSQALGGEEEARPLSCSSPPYCLNTFFIPLFPAGFGGDGLGMPSDREKQLAESRGGTQPQSSPPRLCGLEQRCSLSRLASPGVNCGIWPPDSSLSMHQLSLNTDSPSGSLGLAFLHTLSKHT